MCVETIAIRQWLKRTRELVLHGYYCLPLICYKKSEFKQRFTDFQKELEKDTDITPLKRLEKMMTSRLQSERRKNEVNVVQ